MGEEEGFGKVPMKSLRMRVRDLGSNKEGGLRRENLGSGKERRLGFREGEI